MTKTFMEILDEEEIDLAVGPFASFLIPPGSHDGDRTWSRYAYGYDAAFRELFETAWQAWPRRDYLVEPVIFTGRHALELAMKDAADRLSWHTGELVKFLGHSLSERWEELLRQLRLAEYSTLDEWTAHCSKIIAELHTLDPDGMRFRYPNDKANEPFVNSKVELEDFGRAYWHISTYCDAVTTMVQESDG
ncbi:hypothetical protein ACQKOH_00020 [Sphingomonas sp. NPDC092331]|jgi:hypothetical protein|uniref:hypothetical protein n=2 Tax=Pseudomonadota TaxID=1224 RepID=UPI0031F4B030